MVMAWIRRSGPRGALALAAAMMIMAGGHAWAGGAYVITDRGLQSGAKLMLGRNTRVHTSLLRRLFPRFRVVLRDFYDEMNDYTQITYTIYKGKKKIIEIELDDSRIYDMMINTDLVADKYGIRVGDTFGRLRATGAIACVEEAETGFHLFCSRRGEKVQFLFKNPYFNSRFAVKSPRPSTRARIIGIRWR